MKKVVVQIETVIMERVYVVDEEEGTFTCIYEEYLDTAESEVEADFDLDKVPEKYKYLEYDINKYKEENGL